MRKLFAFVAIVSVLALVGCASPNNPDPPPPPPACQTNNTGTMTATNKSPDGTSRTVIVDGANWGIIAANQTLSRTVTAGHDYLMQFYRSSNNLYIQGAVVTVTQCGSNGLVTTASEG